MYGDLDSPRRGLPVPGRAGRRAGAGRRLPARPRAPVPGGVRRRRWRRTAGSSSTPTSSASTRPGSASAATRPAATSRRASRSRPPGTGWPLAFQLLVYPATDAGRETRSCASCSREGFYLTSDFMDLGRRGYYRRRRPTCDDPRLSPLYADLPGRPGAGATSCTAGFDPLRDEGEAYAAPARRRRGRGRAAPLPRPDPRLLQHRRGRPHDAGREPPDRPGPGFRLVVNGARAAGYPRPVRRILSMVVVALLASAAFAAPAHAMTPGPTASAERGQPRALFFGDSYFVGGGCSPDAKQDMAHLAGTELGYRTTVRGAGGTGFVAANPDYDLPPYLGQIQDGALDVRNPKLVVIEGGSNDVGRPVGEVRTNARKILRIAAAQVPARAGRPGRAARPVRRLRRQHPDPQRAAGGRQEAGRAVHRRHDLARRPPRVAVRRLRAPDVRRPGAARGAAREGAQEARRLIRRTWGPLGRLQWRCGTPGPSAGRGAAAPRPRGLCRGRERHAAGELGQADHSRGPGGPLAHRPGEPAGADRVRPRVGADHVAVLRRLLHRRGRLHRPEELHGRDRRPSARLAVPDPRWRRHRLRVRQPGLRHPGLPRADPGRRARRGPGRLAGHRGRRQRQERRPADWSPGARSGPSRPRPSGTRRPGWCWSGRWTRPSTASPTPTA